MDQRLLEASRCGDVGALENLLQEDPFILEKVSLSDSAETPLHVASLAGHIDFVKRIVRLNPSFASELNKDGFTPLHIAAAQGQLEIASELLAAGGNNLCLLTDKGGRTPLHRAATKGRVTIIDKLLCECPEAFERVTIYGDTALRLAVKNSQFEAFKILFKFSEKLHNHEERMKTILELAIVSKQLQVTDLLTKRNILNNEVIENLPADVRSQMFPKDEDIIISDPPRARKQEGQPRSIISALRILCKNKGTPVMASMIATATYNALLSPPQVIWKEGMKFDTKCLSHYFGFHISQLPAKDYISCPALRFYSFMILNTIAFTTSVFLIPFHGILGLAAPILVVVCIYSLILNYMTLLWTMSPNNKFAWIAFVTLMLTLLSIPLLMLPNIWLRRITSRLRRHTSDSNPSQRPHLPPPPLSDVKHSDDSQPCVPMVHQNEARV